MDGRVPFQETSVQIYGNVRIFGDGKPPKKSGVHYYDVDTRDDYSFLLNSLTFIYSLFSTSMFTC